MQRTISFSFRLTSIERQLIRQLASELQRSQSDAVRFVVIEAARQLSQSQTSPDPDQVQPVPAEVKQGGKNETG